MNNPKVSVIIVNYNGAPFLDRLFRSLQRQTFKDFETVFVDNASIDNSLDIVNSFIEKRILRITIRKLSENTGFCKGNNIGYEISKGRYIALLNNDTYVSPSWLEELVRVLDMDSSIGICQSKEIDVRNRLTAWGNYLGVYGKRNQGNHFKIINDVYEGFFYASGTSLIIRRNVIESMGCLFDENQFTGDMDLSWRVRLMGFNVVTNLKSICYHFQGYTTDKILKNAATTSFVLETDRLRTFIKNYSAKRFFKRSFLFFFFVFIRLGYHSLSKKFPCLFSAIKAIAWNVFYFRDSWTEHIKVQVARKASDDEIEKYMLPYMAELYFLRLKLKACIPERTRVRYN